MSDQPTQSVPRPIPCRDRVRRPAGPTWFQRLTSVLIIVFCLELGLFLLIYPWTDSWSDNYFAWAVPGSARMAWHSFWANSYRARRCERYRRAEPLDCRYRSVPPVCAPRAKPELKSCTSAKR